MKKAGKKTMNNDEIEAMLAKVPVEQWTAEVGERLSDGLDCWVIDSESGSVAEMMCPKDNEEAFARLIAAAPAALRELLAERDALLAENKRQQNAADAMFRKIEELLDENKRLKEQHDFRPRVLAFVQEKAKEASKESRRLINKDDNAWETWNAKALALSELVGQLETL
jgi:hypothetical protein